MNQMARLKASSGGFGSLGEWAGAVAARCRYCGNGDPRLQLKPGWDPLQRNKLVQLLEIRKVGLRSSRADGGHDVHDPMVCLGDNNGCSSSPCVSCICWAFGTLGEIAKIVGVELPEREELT